MPRLACKGSILGILEGVGKVPRKLFRRVSAGILRLIAPIVTNQPLLLNSNWPQAAKLEKLNKDEVHVWAVPLVVSQSAADEFTRLLSDEERNRANDFRFDDPRRRFVFARGALRRLLGDYLGVNAHEVELATDDNQKPHLAKSHDSAGLKFNVSHSGDLALIAVTTGCEIGVDVEQLRAVSHLEQIARRFFHPAETEAVLATSIAERNSAFLRCWTAKEAILKALGTGITGSLADLQVPIRETTAGWVNCSGSRCWLQQLAPCDAYVGAVACVDSERPVRQWRLEA